MHQSLCELVKTVLCYYFCAHALQNDKKAGIRTAPHTELLLRTVVWALSVGGGWAELSCATIFRLFEIRIIFRNINIFEELELLYPVALFNSRVRT